MYDCLPIIKLLSRSIVVIPLLTSAVTAAGGVGADKDKQTDIAVADDSGAGISDSADQQYEVRQWAESFYLQRPLCGTSEVRDIAIYDDRILVSLDIDPRWEVSLNKLDQSAAGRWFAIHCPLPVATAEPALGQRDITIISTSADNPHTNFSCREFERSLKGQVNPQNRGVRAKIVALLERIGVRF